MELNDRLGIEEGTSKLESIAIETIHNDTERTKNHSQLLFPGEKNV